jgi:cytochrome P450
MREMRLIVGRLLRRYEINLIPGQSYERRVHGSSYLVQGFYNVGVKRRAGVTP